MTGEGAAQAGIRELKKEDSAKLEEFLRGLPDDVYDTWNRFGLSAAEIDLKETAQAQCRKLRSEEIGFVAADDADRIVGYAYLRFFSGKAAKKHNVSLGIVVAADQQGKSIGKHLMLHMHRWAERNGIKKIWLATYARNHKALKLYLGLGYEVEGVFMYDEQGKHGWDHVVSMALMLDKSFNRSRTEREALIAKIVEGER